MWNLLSHRSASTTYRKENTLTCDLITHHPSASLSCLIFRVCLFLAMSGTIQQSPRSYDVAVLGATGFTGQLVAEYLSKSYPTGLRWAIVGRNKDKLLSLHSKLKLADSVGVLIADAEDQASLDVVAAQTKVILSTAGPFALIGTPVIDACVRCNTHYCDITGESPWIRTVIDQYHDQAAEKQLKIVNCCGFDCIPADLGSMMIIDEMKNQNITPTEVRFICKEMKGGASGGTIASVLNIFSTTTIKKLMESSDPFFLTMRDTQTGEPTRATDRSVVALNRDSFGFCYDKTTGGWLMPWVMQSIDTRIVNRSNALSGWKYGRNLIYREHMAAPNVFAAIISTCLFPFAGSLLYFSLTRNIIKAFVPKQGEGPNQDMLDNGFLKVLFWGRGNNSAGEEVVVKGGVMAHNGDPGYRQTAKFIAEAGISLALDEPSLPRMYGILTPSTALGCVLMDRLRVKGVDFYIGEHKK